jgi:hypothetical protein
MNKYFVATIFFIISACASQEQSEIQEREKREFKNLLVAAKEQSKNDLYQKYIDEVFLPFNNKYRLDERAGCYSLGNSSIDIVLQITEAGLVEGVSVWPTNKKGNCFKESYTGIQLPSPPYFPFLLNLGMQ